MTAHREVSPGWKIDGHATVFCPAHASYHCGANSLMVSENKRHKGCGLMVAQQAPISAFSASALVCNVGFCRTVHACLRSPCGCACWPQPHECKPNNKETGRARLPWFPGNGSFTLPVRDSCRSATLDEVRPARETPACLLLEEATPCAYHVH